MRVAIYLRCSMEEQKPDKRQFQSLENQEIPLRQWCAAMGYEIVAVYSDKLSGANPNRPGFRQMMQDAMMRRFHGVVVWKLDRQPIPLTK